MVIDICVLDTFAKVERTNATLSLGYFLFIQHSI